MEERFILKNGKYYYIDSSENEIEATLDKDGYFIWKESTTNPIFRNYSTLSDLDNPKSFIRRSIKKYTPEQLSDEAIVNGTSPLEVYPSDLAKAIRRERIRNEGIKLDSKTSFLLNFGADLHGARTGIPNMTQVRGLRTNGKDTYLASNSDRAQQARQQQTTASILGASIATFPVAYGLAPGWLQGAFNLGMAVEGYNNIIGPEGQDKTTRLWKEGDYLGSIKSGIGDALNATAILFPAYNLSQKTIKPFTQGFIRGITRNMPKYNPRQLDIRSATDVTDVNYIDLDKFYNQEFSSPIVTQGRSWKGWKSDPSRQNATQRFGIEGQPERGYFELVKDEEPRYWSVHFKPSEARGDAFSMDEKNKLFQQLADAVPEAEYLSTYGSLSPGGFAALRNRFKEYGFEQVGTRLVTSKTTGQVEEIPIWQKVTKSPTIYIDNAPSTEDLTKIPHPFTRLSARPSILTDAEREGINKHDRTNVVPYLQGSTSNVPEDIMLINRGKYPYTFENGKIVWTPIKTQIGRGKRLTAHFTLDRPVTSHSAGDWDLASETMIVPYKHVVELNGQPLNISPMDTYFGGFGRFSLDQNKVKILTANPKNYRKYKLQGINSEYSEESNKLITEGERIQNQIDNLLEKSNYNPNALSEQDFQLYYSLIDKLSEIKSKNYNLVLKWTEANGRRPTIEDINIIENESELKSGAEKINPYGIQSLLNKNIQYENSPKEHSNDFLSAFERYEKGLDYFEQYDYLQAPQRLKLFNEIKQKYPELFNSSIKGMADYSYNRRIQDLDWMKKLFSPLPFKRLPEYAELENNLEKYTSEYYDDILYDLLLMQDGNSKLPPDKLYTFDSSILYDNRKPIVVKEIPKEYGDKIAGFHRTYTGDNIVLDTPKLNPYTIAIHEGASHATDGLITDETKYLYNEILDILKGEFDPIKNSYRLFPIFKFKTKDSNEWYEIRATLNQVRDKLRQYWKLANGKINLENINKVSDYEILNALKESNSYGKDYYNAYWKLSPELRKEAMQRIRHALKYLPLAGTPVLISNNS